LLYGGYRLAQWYLDVRQAVQVDQVAKIADGMSEGEVEGLLGRSGDHRTQVKRTLARGETLDLEGKVFPGPCEVRATIVDWVPRHGGYVRVAFDDRGKVFSRGLVNAHGDSSPSGLRKARKWFLGF
jgi:hypothetical protein